MRRLRISCVRAARSRLCNGIAAPRASTCVSRAAHRIAITARSIRVRFAAKFTGKIKRQITRFALCALCACAMLRCAQPWIRCDDCHRWVMCSCDGITDLWVFDDNNPGHIKYSCPLCREEMEDEAKAKGKRLREDQPKRRGRGGRRTKKKSESDDEETPGLIAQFDRVEREASAKLGDKEDTVREYRKKLLNERAQLEETLEREFQNESVAARNAHLSFVKQTNKEVTRTRVRAHTHRRMHACSTC
jgi:hypothetical protein